MFINNTTLALILFVLLKENLIAQKKVFDSVVSRLFQKISNAVN